MAEKTPASLTSRVRKYTIATLGAATSLLAAHTAAYAGDRTASPAARVPAAPEVVLKGHLVNSQTGAIGAEVGVTWDHQLVDGQGNPLKLKNPLVNVDGVDAGVLKQHGLGDSQIGQIQNSETGLSIFDMDDSGKINHFNHVKLVPSAAGAPSAPGAPGSPSAPPSASPPGGPAAPGAPGAPSASGPTPPGAPETPGAPKPPYAPPAPPSAAAPGAPGAPGAPDAPGAPKAPGAPSTIGAPSAPPAPGAPGAPSAPGVPAAPGAPAAPGEPSAPPAPPAPPPGHIGGHGHGGHGGGTTIIQSIDQTIVVDRGLGNGAIVTGDTSLQPGGSVRVDTHLRRHQGNPAPAPGASSPPPPAATPAPPPGQPPAGKPTGGNNQHGGDHHRHIHRVHHVVKVAKQKCLDCCDKIVAAIQAQTQALIANQNNNANREIALLQQNNALERQILEGQKNKGWHWPHISWPWSSKAPAAPAHATAPRPASGAAPKPHPTAYVAPVQPARLIQASYVSVNGQPQPGQPVLPVTTPVNDRHEWQRTSLVLGRTVADGDKPAAQAVREAWSQARRAFTQWNKSGNSPAAKAGVETALSAMQSRLPEVFATDADQGFKAARYLVNKGDTFSVDNRAQLLGLMKANLTRIHDEKLAGQAERYVARMERKLGVQPVEQPMRPVGLTFAVNGGYRFASVPNWGGPNPTA